MGLEGSKVFLYVICIIFLVLEYSRRVAAGDPKFPCYFIFGDSLLDVGNNNRLNTGAKANYLPYGIDYPQGPTGRFTKDLGFDNFIPPYATVKEKCILTGVNYASGGSGILDKSGQNLGERFSFNKQIRNHKKVISRIKTLQGNETHTHDYLKKCLYMAQTGSNDYINNYFAPVSKDKTNNVTPDQFAIILINQFSRQLNWLYKLGGRKFSISNIGQVGCAPAQITLYGTGNACINEMNDAVNIFNVKKNNLIENILKSKLTDAKFVVPDLNIPTSGLPQSNGTAVTNAACCKVSTKGDTRGLCLRRKIPCIDRNRYQFFDGFHPTAYANLFYSRQMMLAISQLL
ncbi:hypothetical protein L2E82_30656 [Cichorium intybus]|uniref:Uncharacterized protein n=1 Tax=Cichorium intybus TaxID=13427 RepID=A0ACB9D1G1_CICIN|nr:hypothetical protein L2E82_30656 [Cichorium intybus]